MRFPSSLVSLIAAGSLLFSVFGAQAQNKEKSYKSLLWEITGNGLKKPSYLFGTMHISNKMVFHLSDSFYAAIRNADVVAIELNPEQWQSEIPRINKQGDVYKYYNATYYTDYLKENSFMEGDFLSLLRESLRFEPALNDALLYRNESRMDNFQEDTYLDLYIYQTGKKLGKQTAGVETFLGAQRMMMEAVVDAAAEKDKKRPDLDGVPYQDLNQSLQDAYRRGDLDVLDSINKITEYAQSFTEKFLYKRNEIQAASMDSIMKRQSLFVGVGAAHLPGKRGVIEILRKKGYLLRPVYMQDRDATQKQYIDSLTVPVTFTRQYAADSFYSVSVPGKLNEIESRSMHLDHYADMANGAYYLITRIKTNVLFNGFDAAHIMKVVDSLLYEDIPGTILSHKAIAKNGYPGMDIVNRTRKGDIQHYQLFFTPSELFIFKMGGKGNYVNGAEAATFFGTISFKPQEAQPEWKWYSPASGGFKVKMPADPQIFYQQAGKDNLPEWKYEATDPVSKDHYAVFRKSIYSFDFIEADTFDLMLMTESLGSDPAWEEKKTYRDIRFRGRPAREISFRAKDGAYLQARAVLLGPQYYLLVYRSENQGKNAAAFFDSFEFMPFQYGQAKPFVDTIQHFKVNTSVKPMLDDDVLDMMMYVKRSEPLLQQEAAYYKGIPDIGFANFVSEETGEVIVVNSYKYPEYYFIKDSTAFWNSHFYPDSSLVLYQKTRLDKGLGVQAWMLEWSDTASTRLIRKLVLLNGMNMITATTMRDSTLPLSSFIAAFSNSFGWDGSPAKGNLFANKQDLFFRNYYSTDSLVHKKAKMALPSVYFDKTGFPRIIEAIGKLKPQSPDYYETKAKFINELGYITDSTVTDALTARLKQMYLDAGDTTLFQNSILKSLARMGRPAATALFKELILQDPPAFESKSEYIDLFSVYTDSLKLATALFPELLNLTAIEDFKSPVRQLLAALADSNYIAPALYEDFVGNIYFDAKITAKKMQYAQESVQGQDREENSYGQAYRSANENMLNADMLTYVKLLAPFYNKNPNLPKFFDKLLTQNNLPVKMQTALSLLKYKQPVADTVWKALAREKNFRSELWAQLKDAGRTDLFPAQYRTHEVIASDLINASYGSRLDTVALLNHSPVVQKNKAITTYFFKYKLKQSEDWKLGLSSVLQEKGRSAEGYGELMLLSNKKLATSAAGLNKQIEEQLKKLLISRTNSGREFYRESVPAEEFSQPEY
jgi:uncharacterized protein YbaP (TraB family)